MATDKKDYDAIQFLLDNRANPHIQDNKGHDACDYAKYQQI